MGKKAANSQQNGKTKQPNQGSLHFFNPEPITPSAEVSPIQQTQQVKQPVPEIKLQSTTDILLAAILQELQTQNMLALMKIKDQQEQKREELQAAEEMQEHDNERFKEIRQSMYI